MLDNSLHLTIKEFINRCAKIISDRLIFIISIGQFYSVFFVIEFGFSGKELYFCRPGVSGFLPAL
ncbi:MAG: hypothetical protein C4308_09735 [Chitinophagaceae bacterium]